MATFTKGMTVRDRKWGGKYTGTITEVNESQRWVVVQWHGISVSDQLPFDQVQSA